MFLEKKCTKKCAARAKLFCCLDPLIFLAFRCFAAQHYTILHFI